MKILVIDNGTTHLDELRKQLGVETIVKPYSSTQLEKTSEFDGIVLSGGHLFPIEGFEARLGSELKLIRETKVPILGICFGFELIVTAFSGGLTRLLRRVEGLVRIDTVATDPLLEGLDNFTAYSSHRWKVGSLSDEVEVIARSTLEVEAIRHPLLPNWGVQFHPEHPNTQANAVLSNFIKILRTRQIGG